MSSNIKTYNVKMCRCYDDPLHFSAALIVDTSTKETITILFSISALVLTITPPLRRRSYDEPLC